MKTKKKKTKEKTKGKRKYMGFAFSTIDLRILGFVWCFF
tara:strand:- start:82 stop:198 length:117 start_codon:yes stop_codon:yes gene_type:complete